MHLNPRIAHHCQVANVCGTTLTVLAANGAIATELRYQTANLLAKFKQDPQLQHFDNIEYKVRPAFTNRLHDNHHTKSTHNMPPLSKETAATIEEIAESLHHPKLQAIMKKIAKHTS